MSQSTKPASPPASVIKTLAPGDGLNPCQLLRSEYPKMCDFVQVFSGSGVCAPGEAGVGEGEG